MTDGLYRELFEQRLSHLEGMMDLRLENMEDARKLAAEELARRLDILNHAHQEAARILGTYLPRDMAEQKFNGLSDRLHLLESFKSNLQGRFWSLGVVLTVITIIINFAMRYLWQAQ